jgi:hypothetical protein
LSVTHLVTTDEVTAFVSHLHDPQRRRPAALISTSMRTRKPVVDVAEVDAAIHNLADVYIIETGKLTILLTDLVAEGAQCYGGASRVYPPGVEWEKNLTLSPLRFAFTAEDRPKATKDLIDDAHKAARRTKAAPLVQRVHDHNSDVLAEARARAVEAAATRVGGVHSVETGTSSAGELAHSAGAEAAHPEVAYSDAGAASRRLREAHEQIDRIQKSLAAAVEDSREAASDLIAAHAQFRIRGSHAEVQDAHDPLLLENADLRAAMAEMKERHAQQVAGMRSPLRPAGLAEAQVYHPDLFLDPDDAVRNAIKQAWVERVPAAEKAEFPIGRYRVGPAFASSLEKLDESQMSKAFRCVVDVVTNRAKSLASRRVHVLRNGVGGADQATTREDGAVCFRAYIEKNTASARRLHYWKLVDGTIELSRIVTHDDTQP